VDGATVAANDELVLLDPRLAEVELAKASAAVAEKEAALARLKRGYLPQEIEMAQDDVRRATQQAESLRAEFNALKPLWEQKEIPELEYQKAESAVRAAEASQAAAEAKLNLVQAGTPAEEIAEAEALRDTARAELDAARLNLEFCRITSPIGGTVTRLTARRGMFVERATSLLTVADLSKLFIEVRIPRSRATHVGAGARVDVFPTGRSEHGLQGTVARISGEADATTGDMVVFVEVPNEQMQLRPGMTCRAHLWLPPLPNILAVPATAIADQSGTPVVTIARDGKPHEIEVLSGARTHDLVEITQGLSAGDWVVTEGGYGLPEGCPVNIIPEQLTGTAK
jgi:multidrug efflux pump subunit AcrA (membrane-fusion protein)